MAQLGRQWVRFINIPSKEKCGRSAAKNILPDKFENNSGVDYQPQLKNVAGVNEINSFGGYFKQYQVTYPRKDC